ncbi:hypothetical protein BU23DRAFT_475610 [Bimuria novae-zelandiae CBS 107.79]|uniref:Rhodopsin domain-containing protein n=1 Tax=Bimuria novae-zelandiae CBS 107.79 TaxID=1447943 RepID=A0A6A5UZG6_9PLEO|nr:hypothetical protein BU23DRAFT_475610 [Bimuria novae-zelandiae CBS 107.79]
MAFGKSTPKPGQPNRFPPPNFVNPTTRVPIVLGLTISTCILVLLLTGGRIYSRVHLRKGCGVDDCMIMAAAILGVTLTSLGASMCLYGLGYHLWDLRPEWQEPYYKIGFYFSLVYPLCVGLTKMSICQTYLRIFPSQTSHKFSHSMTAFVAAYMLTCVILLFTQCRPLEGYWRKDVEIHCVNMHENMIAIGAINTLTDFIVYLWPAQYLWRIQLPLKQRMGLVFVFTCGLVVCIAGVSRLVYLNRYFTNIDLLWDAAATTSVAIVEVNIGIVCGCLPCVKPLLSRLLPSMFNSHRRTSRNTIISPTFAKSYRFRDMSARQVNKSSSVSALRERTLEDLEEENNDRASAHSTRLVLDYEGRGRVEVGQKDSSRMPVNGIVVDQTVSVEESWLPHV